MGSLIRRLLGLFRRVPGHISRAHAVWAYRLLLDREPESEAVINEKIHAWSTTRELRAEVMASDEFRAKNKTVPDPGRISYDHALWAYRLFLDREPESEGAINAKTALWSTTQDLRAEFMASSEFRARTNATTVPGRISREHAVWAYRLFFDREPENEAAIDEKMHAWSSTQDLRAEFMTSSEFRARNADLAVTSEPTVVIKELDEHLRLFIDLSDLVTGRSILRGAYETDELSFARQAVKPGSLSLDIGANIGLFSIVMAHAAGPAGKVIAFEPLPRNLSLLRRSIAENGFADRVEVVEAAVSAAPGSARLVTPRESLTWGGAYLAPDGSQPPPGHDTVAIATTCLDACSFDRPVSFIKMDIEGAEPQVLRGAANTLRISKPVILVELNPPALQKVSGCTPSEMVELLGSLGYACYALEKALPGSRITTATPVTSMVSAVCLPDGQ